MAEVSTDPLIEKAASDWKKVATGGAIDDFRKDLQAMQQRDMAAGGTKWLDDRDKLNDRLKLPNLQIFDVTDKDVVVTDPTRSTSDRLQLGVLRQDHGLLREEDVDLAATAQAGEYVTKPAAPQPLFDHPEAPLQDITPQHSTQGAQIGDCHFTATLSDMAKENPQAIRDMVKQNPDGSYTVTFPGDKDHPETVGAPNQWELETFATKQGGIWANVIEKAYRQRSQLPFNPPEGGNAADDEHLLTGKPATSVVPVEACNWAHRQLDRYVNGPLFGTNDCGESNQDRSLPEVLDRHLSATPITPDDLPRFLGEAAQNKDLIVAGTKRQFAGPPPTATDSSGNTVAIEANHDYTVINYDATTGMITLRNPHGSNPDAVTRDSVGDGYITMPYSQLSPAIAAVSFGVTDHSSAN
jgi:hypothetical protein